MTRASVVIDVGDGAGDTVAIQIEGKWLLAARRVFWQVVSGPGGGCPPFDAELTVQHGDDVLARLEARRRDRLWLCPGLDAAQIPAYVKRAGRRALNKLST